MISKPILSVATTLSLALSGISLAQFNQIDANGKKVLSDAARQSSTSQTNQASDGPIFARGNQNASIYETGFARDPRNKAEFGIGFGQMDNTEAENWSRMTVHSDESYTVTKEDDSMLEKAYGEVSMLKQETRAAKTGQLLMERFISLNDQGQPSDVLIYDGRKQLKYRGSLLYNRMGKFSEELLYDTKNTLLRRKIQPYDGAGKPQREKVVTYVKNLPPGLQVIVVDEEDMKSGQTTERLNWFKAHREQREMKKQAEERQASNNSPSYIPATPEKKERKGLTGWLFGKRKN